MVIMENHKRSFIHVGNHLAMDLINTQFICHGDIVNALSCYDDVCQWAETMGLELEADNNSADMKAVWLLRDAIKTLMTNRIDQQSLSQDAIEVVNRHLCHAPIQKKLLTIDEEVSLQPLYQKLTLEQLLGKIAHEAAELLASSKHEQIKSCSNEKCILMFLDTSRSKKRRWCSMERCGNRAKAANFYHANKAND
ncbi:MAG: CGNR zinc finger domain-containing protein [Marinomonas sp.]